MSHVWIVYSRAHCDLCDEMVHELAALIGPEAAAAVRVVDVDSQPELAARYGRRVPVLTADDEFVCQYRLDAARVLAYLRSEG